MKTNNKHLLSLGFISIITLMSASPVLAGYGLGPSGWKAPECNNEAPGKPTFSMVRKSGSNQIEIGWNGVDKATSWTVAYGNEKGKYIYGISDFGDSQSRSVKINLLPAGTYYLVVKANNGCRPGEFSDERKMTVYSNGNVLGARIIRPSSGSVLGTKATPTTIESSVTESQPAPTSSFETKSTPISKTSTESENLNIFQRIWRFIFGK